jgi:hypothetical protein
MVEMMIDPPLELIRWGEIPTGREQFSLNQYG